MQFKFKNLLLEPYRLFFSVGPLYAILSVGIWFAYFFLLEHRVSFLAWKQAPLQIHSHLMIYGVIGFYVFGFILTAFPRFVNQPLPSASQILLLWTGLLLSQIFLILGTFYQEKWMGFAAVFEIASYMGLLGLLTRLYIKEGKFRQNSQPIFILTALFFGVLGSLFFYLTAAFHLSMEFYRLSTELGTYLYLLFLVVSITYRIVPFFTGSVIAGYIPRRGRFTLQIVLAVMLFHLLSLLLFENFKIYDPLSRILNLTLFLILAREWKNWLPSKIRQAPMLMVLYVGLAWILVFLGFNAASFPLSPTSALHALFVGAFGTLLLGISTRVVRGHGGLPLVADPWMLVALLLLQMAAILRVFFPVATAYWGGLLWCIAFALWGIRYVPLLGRSR